MGNFSGRLASPLGPEWKSEDQCSVSVTVIGISPLRIVEANMQEKSLEETNEVGEVVKMLGKAAQMKMTSKQLKEEVGKVVTKANPEAREKFNKCENSFPYEPGADSEQSKIKEVKEIDPSAHWIRWRKCGAAECFPRLSKKAEMAEAQTSSKEEKTKSSHPEMKVDGVLYTA